MPYFVLVYILGAVVTFGHALGNNNFEPESHERPIAALGTAFMWPLYVSWNAQYQPLPPPEEQK